MSPQRVHAALEAWRAAERERDALDPDSTEWLIAEASVIEAHEAYLAISELVAAETGAEPSYPPSQMPSDSIA